MMENINLYSISYYEKTVFTGSYRGLCFRILKAEDSPGDVLSGEDMIPEDGAMSGGSDEPAVVLRVMAWKGPYVLEKTKEEVHTEDFSYSDEGLNAANEWLEEKQREVIGND